jgi:hypothetical protein
MSFCNVLSNTFNLNYINFEPPEKFNWLDAFGPNTNRFGFNYNRIVMFRMFSFLIILASLVESVTHNMDNGCLLYWGLYLTHLTVCIVVLYSVTGLYITFKLHNFPDEFNTHLIPRYVRFHWASQNTVLILSFIVPVGFWVICIVSDSPTESCYVTKEPNTLFLHGINSILVIADIIITNQPFMVLHGIYPFVFGCIYLFITYLHNKFSIGDCEHPNQHYPIYNELDWNNSYTIYKWYITLTCITTFNYFGWYIYYRKYRVKGYQKFDNNQCL